MSPEAKSKWVDAAKAASIIIAAVLGGTGASYVRPAIEVEQIQAHVDTTVAELRASIPDEARISRIAAERSPWLQDRPLVTYRLELHDKLLAEQRAQNEAILNTLNKVRETQIEMMSRGGSR